MKVKDIYQDSDGDWHIDYYYANLVALAIRVYLGEFFLTLNILVLLLPFIMVMVASGKSLPAENSSSFPGIQQDSIKKSSGECLFILKDNTTH